MNNTFVINVGQQNLPVLIERFYSKEIFVLDKPDQLEIFGSVRISSVLIYFTAILTLHLLLILQVYNKNVVLIFLFISTAIALLAGLFFLLHTKFMNVENFYYLSRVLKDFVMSPVFLVLFILLIKFFKRSTVH